MRTHIVIVRIRAIVRHSIKFVMFKDASSFAIKPKMMRWNKYIEYDASEIKAIIGCTYFIFPNEKAFAL